MREKNGLDRSISNFINFSSEELKKSKERKRTKQKVSDFNKKALNCENFCLKNGEMRLKTYWCKEINKFCIYSNCPKNKI